MRKKPNIFLQKLGAACRDFRKSIGKTLSDVAHDTGYSKQNISFFEKGKNDTLKIYMWYVNHGFECFIETGGNDNGTNV